MTTLPPGPGAMEASDIRYNSPGNASPTRVRRVLGDLTPNARCLIQEQHNALDHKAAALSNSSPLKANRSPTRIDLSPSKLVQAMSSPLAGKKRTIDEVDGVMGADNVGRGRSSMQDGTISGRWRVLSDTKERSTHTPIRNFVDLPSDASSTDEDTPRPAKGGASQEMHSTQESFASLINYDPMEFQQNEALAGKANTRTQLETLKLRLQMAMYKVNTNQTYLPLSQLQVPTASVTSSTRQESGMESPAHLRTHPPTIIISPSKSSASGKSSNQLQILPTPMLLPTAYSSRFITSVPQSSSPTMSPNRAAQGLLSMADARTPVATRRALVHEDQPSSEASDEEEDGLLRRRSLVEDDVEMPDSVPSSVVKGRVANGLLNLRRCAE